MKIFRMLTVALVATICATSASAVTILYGKDFSFHHEYAGNSFWAQDFTAGTGTEVEITFRGRTAYTVDITENQLLFQMGGFNFTQGGGFNGIVLRDTSDNLPDFRTLTQNGGTFGSILPTIVTENEIRIDFSTAGRIAGRSVVFDIEVAPVPLPASGAMLAMAIGGCALMRRRTRKI